MRRYLRIHKDVPGEHRYGTQTYLLDAMGTLSIEKFSLRTTCDTNRFITVTTIP